MLLYVTYLTSSRVLFVSPPPPLSLSLPLSFRLSPLFHICYYRTLTDKRKGSSCRYGTQLDRNATVRSPLRTTEELWGSSWCLTSLMKNHSKLWEDGKKEKEKGGWGRGGERGREVDCGGERGRIMPSKGQYWLFCGSTVYNLLSYPFMHALPIYPSSLFLDHWPYMGHE